jgi:hypothetical protein
MWKFVCANNAYILMFMVKVHVKVQTQREHLCKWSFIYFSRLVVWVGDRVAVVVLTRLQGNGTRVEEKEGVK